MNPFMNLCRLEVRRTADRNPFEFPSARQVIMIFRSMAGGMVTSA
jgi:hypothetical protein